MMIEKSTIEFLKELNVNNNRDWFQENKPRYEKAKANSIEVASTLIEKINEFDKTLGFIDPRKTLFRINRDTRFSNNKDPYKNNMGMYFALDGVTRGSYAGYYLHIEPGASLLAAGVYMAEKHVVDAIRNYIEQNFSEFESIVKDKKFVETFKELSKDGKVLKRVPRGFNPESPAAEYLKFTNFSVMYPVSDAELTSKEFVSKKCLEVYKVAVPLIQFLNKAIQSGL